MQFLKKIILYILLFKSLLFAHQYEISICAIFQNEAPYLREWIEFHKLVGVEHFYLFNNLSNDEYNKVLAPYIKSGEVELIEWGYNTNPDGQNWPIIQMSAYNFALNMCNGKTKWLAILDIDEFLFPVQTNNLKQFLRNYENAAALVVNWQMFGTSNEKKLSSKDLLIEKLIYKAPTYYPENTHVKSIVRPEFVMTCVNPHCCALLPGHIAVNADLELVSGATTPIKIDKIRINHYWCRDEHFFKTVKLPRRQKWQDGSILERAKNLNIEVDKSIHKYVPKLKSKLKEGKKK